LKNIKRERVAGLRPLGCCLNLLAIVKGHLYKILELTHGISSSDADAEVD